MTIRKSLPPHPVTPSPSHLVILPPSPLIYAVVPAAGLSQRMGRPKLSLVLGGKSVLEHVVDALVRSKVDRTVVVVGQSSRSLAELIHGPDVEVLTLPEDTRDMRATVTAGLAYLTKKYSPSPTDAFLLALGDQPTIRTEIVDRLIEAHRSDPSRIRVPVFAAKRGHPVLFPWSITSELEDLPADRGLDLLLKSQPGRVAELTTDREDVLEDLDEPADYERSKRRTWD